MDYDNKLLTTRLNKHMKECKCILSDKALLIKADTTILKIKEKQPHICLDASNILYDKIHYYKRLRQLRKI